MTQSATVNRPLSRLRGPVLTLTVALVATSLSPAAVAEPTEADRTAAEALFREGKRLMDEENYAEACPKLAESQRRDPGGGTLLATAICHEKEGKLATAWAEFREALGLARAQGRQDRIDLAEEHIAGLEPRLPKLTVRVPPIEGLEVTLDDAAAVIDTALPVDPGEHELVATAPGKKPWSETFTMAAAEQRTIEVPALEEALAPAPAPGPEPEPAPAPTPTPPADSAGGGTQQILGFVVGGLGIAGIAVGAVAGSMAISKRGDSDDECPNDQCTQAGVDLNEEAKSAALVSNIGIFGGLGLVAVGTVLVLTASSDDEPTADAARRGSSWQLGPSLGPEGGAILLRGTF